jgi:CRP/FNR family cyclic AMP-dependent transcriptional regulator
VPTKEQQELALVLSGITVFSGLDETQIGQLAAQFQQVECQAGEELMTEGVRGDKLSVVVDGGIEVFLPASNDRISEIKLAEMGPGELFGEYSFVDMRPASASVRAKTDCRLLQVGYVELYRLLGENDSLARRFYENLLLVLIDRRRADDRELDMFTLA